MQDMVVEIRPDLGRVQDRGDAVFGQMIAVADTGQHQDLRRADGTRRQHHLLPGADMVQAVAVAEDNACHAPPLQRQAQHLRAGQNAQVRPFARRIKKRLARVPADAAPLVHREIAHAFIVAGVEIGACGDAHLLRGKRHLVENGPVQALLFHS